MGRGAILSRISEVALVPSGAKIKSIVTPRSVV
jgi:hypothetical protein